MTMSPYQGTGNNLLDRMSACDFLLLEPHLRPVRLRVGDVLMQAMEPSADAYFVTDGLISVVAAADNGGGAEVGVYGYEGMGPAASVLGSDRCTYTHTVQGAGNALAIDAFELAGALADSRTLQGLLLRYAQTFNVMTAHTAVANCSFTLDKRIARWLLMCQDRCHDVDIRLTHTLLARLLHARRPSVTHAIQSLEGDGYLRARREQIQIVDRQGLRDIAGNSYGSFEAEYRRLIGPPGIFGEPHDGALEANPALAAAAFP